MLDPMAAHNGVKKELRSLGIFILLLIAGYWFFVRPHVDNFDVSEEQCETLNHFWTAKAQKDFELTNEWNLGPFECPSEELGMARALYFLSELDVAIAGKLPEQTYYAWAKRAKPKFDKRILFGFVGRTKFETGTIEISPRVLEKNNWIKIAGIIVHELRHLEQGINTHVPCANNPAAACDPRLERDPYTGGAYNYNMLFFDQLRNMPTVTQYEKKLALREMQKVFDKHFNEVSPGDGERYQLALSEGE